MKYAIIDIETTGSKAARDKITEIAIVIHDGQRMLDSFESLVNPEVFIPYNITQITGITQDMVANAPKFYEIAKEVVQLTEGAVFVAHNVRFDYSFIREEFQRLGFVYTRKLLCTVRLSRKVFPGLRYYGLDNLIAQLNLTINSRHRAMGDTMATVQLFEKILAKEKGTDEAKDLINLGVKESRLPANITLEKLHALPESCGVYYFYDLFGEVVYVGKSINIKKRVMEHFADNTAKAAKLQKYVHEISYEITGSELIALLYESYEIKRLHPLVNRAQRIRHFPFAIYQFKNDKGYICFGIQKTTTKTRHQIDIVSEYPKLATAKAHLERCFRDYDLCALHSGLETGSGPCFYFHIKQCKGACIGAESVEVYNEKVAESIDTLSTIFDKDFVIIDRGKTADEKAIILVQNGHFAGYGYIDVNQSFDNKDALLSGITSFVGNPETSKIIRYFLSKNKVETVNV